MNWGDDFLDFFHRLWFEITHILDRMWARVRPLLWLYLLIIFALIAAAVIGGLVVLGGTVFESDWVIFWGGLILLGSIFLIGVIIIPAIWGVKFFRAVIRRITGV